MKINFKSSYFYSLDKAQSDLRKTVHTSNQHMQVIESDDGACQVTFCMIQLFDVPGDFLYLKIDRNIYINNINKYKIIFLPVCMIYNATVYNIYICISKSLLKIFGVGFKRVFIIMRLMF